MDQGSRIDNPVAGEGAALLEGHDGLMEGRVEAVAL